MGELCGGASAHPETDITAVVQGDGVFLLRIGGNLVWIVELMGTWFEVEVKAMLEKDTNRDNEH